METIREGEEMVYPRSSQLPFSLPEEEARIGIGSTSTVYKVTVKRGYFQYQEHRNRNFDVSNLLITYKQLTALLFFPFRQLEYG
jgi:hypothetical protein